MLRHWGGRSGSSIQGRLQFWWSADAPASRSSKRRPSREFQSSPASPPPAPWRLISQNVRRLLSRHLSGAGILTSLPILNEFTAPPAESCIPGTHLNCGRIPFESSSKHLLEKGAHDSRAHG